ncbi:MAG: hydrogenase iron-sulfur subunit [Deltaproteobacteria bacterium]|nr:hydrogenase iron-sulfur subunit [Deltaproteobacteria bacterium]
MENIFEPSIIAFCCRWCSYSAADLAGSMRLQYPHNVRIILVPCTGRVDIKHVLHALEKGADGVFLSGCLIGECHYIVGNVKAAKRMAHAKRLVEEAGIEPERVEMFYNAASMGPQFAETCTKFTETIRALGPIYRPGTVKEADDSSVINNRLHQ